ncbi:hypothetical protein [Arcicella lustrica]|uniref:Uncharacterized protein n=1 Tax=Arcicella lustrica TaxID=2984196 RepID=A0ABU5SKS7_9BACT|nr:hypothetical protein [Arcicella sp. DC25W]MEA5427787.1 hypothetical protein [Arcicella sp. DC25W]
MKTLVKNFAIALFTTVSFFANATTDTNEATNAKKTFAVGIYQTINTLKMNVMIDKLAGKKITIQLKNEDGEVIHTEIVGKKETAYRGNYDLKELEDGKYSFEISDGNAKIVKNVQVGTTKPAPSSSDRFISLN